MERQYEKTAERSDLEQIKTMIIGMYYKGIQRWFCILSKTDSVQLPGTVQYL